jgi:hypothetical protein
LLYCGFEDWKARQFAQSVKNADLSQDGKAKEGARAINAHPIKN